MTPDKTNDSRCKRPSECASCPRKMTVRLTRIGEEGLSDFYLCDQCPLPEKWMGRIVDLPSGENRARPVCGNCQMTTEELVRGKPLGCAACYEVFFDFILRELKEKDLLSGSSEIAYAGHRPGEAGELSPSLKLFALKEALRETVSREDYEEAARIRDQIHELHKKGTPE